MSGETESAPSAWTIDSVLVHLRDVTAETDRRYEQRFEAQERAVAAALLAAEKAVTKAETAAEKRFDAVNEFRRALTDQTAGFIPRAEYSHGYAGLAEKVADLTTRFTRVEGKAAGLSASWLLLGQAVSLLAAVIAVVLHVTG